MPGWEQLGMQAASQATSGILGLALGGINDRRQLRQQERLQNLQIAGNKQLTDYNFMKQMEMWKNTNFPAQMAMLKAAGLNPALMYESGGAGAETTISPGNTEGTHAPTGGGEIMQMMGMGLNRHLQAAQIENIEADTQQKLANIPKTQAETGKIGAETTQIQQDINESITRIAKISQEIKNLQAQESLTTVETGLKQIQTQYETATLNDKIHLINQSVQQAQQAIRIIRNQADISDATKENQIKQISANLFQTWAHTRLINASKDLTDQQLQTEKEQLNKIAAEIIQGRRHLDIEKFRAETDRSRERQQANEQDDPIGETLRGMGILLPIPGFKTKPNPIGFKQK